MKRQPFPKQPVFLIDDEEKILESAARVLRSGGISNTLTCQDSRNVVGVLKEQAVDVIVLDLSMPHIAGKELLPVLIEKHPEIPVIVMTGLNDLELAVTCMRMGAFDYMVKPVEDSRFISGVVHAIEFREMERMNSALRDSLFEPALNSPDAFSHIITCNQTMWNIFKYVEAIANTSRPVLITGETGVGKELIAKAIHTLSDRPGEFVSINSGGLDDTLFSDTLFGHRKGAFTGADQPRKGLLEQAASGTIFLDEIGDLEMPSQVKLLRLLQEREYYPLGSDLPKSTNARIIVATHHDLNKKMADGEFRKDFYFRIKTHSIHIPPLRERREDIPILFEQFLEESALELNKKAPHYPPELLVLLDNYRFPGNVRELQNVVFDAMSRHKKGTLSMDSFRSLIGNTQSDISVAVPTVLENSLRIAEDPNLRFPTLKEAEYLLIQKALQKAKGNQSVAAQLLGLSRSALSKRLTRREENNPD